MNALTYLAEHHVLTLATHGADGPWAAAVFYVNDGYTLFFLSSPKSRHARNLASEPRVAGTVQEDYAEWTEIRGIQLEGRVRELVGAEALRARELYGAKFAVVGAQAPAPIVAALAKVSWYELVPDHLHFVDNSVAFGHRDEIALPAST
jgi:uncharacterized protein YhbP (UPF0306 family)